MTGAASQIGVFLLPLLARQGHAVTALTRDVSRIRAGRAPLDRLRDEARWVEHDLTREAALPEAAEILIHIAPLVLLPDLIPAFAARGGRRVIAFGTTSRVSKSLSGDSRERAMAGRVAAAETQLAQRCAAHGVAWTLLRPTLVYGAGMDRNVTLIANLIRRFGFFPLFGAARGLRQPVHAADLADACVLALGQPASCNKVYNLAGLETIEYREMVRRIFVALGRPPRLLRVPMVLFRIAMWGISRVPRFRDFNPEMVRRMNEDLVFDHAEAVKDFGYAPRPFSPTFGPLDG